ncbi:MAG: D-alanine aminotransferase [SAR86 cluster bacterium]|jgi:D-alanine transaminase|uniref:Aminodeoxychorismate lyase n=1 Tax=SAR86 cluster bacterium TaxID=2030880 RepID=A0A520N1P0_9GAMM|nr:MAG: D-alanine aminotransferase [SAR86 cluster bacterium]|tara:strand:+ start:1746 stop:2573 length:828 start_codon:yes stop_codon:yes gene_type:complete
MENTHAVHNGIFNYLNEIKISPLSRAYTFSDSVYEVIPFYNFNIIAFDEHITRLDKSCNSLSFKADIEKIAMEIKQLIKKSNLKNGYVYYQISRGIDPIRSHMFDANIQIETFGYVVEHAFKSKTLKVMLCEDLRWQRCDIKSTSLLGNVMSMNDAKDKGCEEVIMHKNNFITEGGASNIFFVKDNLVMTPALTNNILPGITRELLIKAIKNEGIDVQEGKYTLEDLIDSESMWLTSSTKGLAEVGEVINTKTKLIQGHELFKKCKDVFTKKFFS